MTFFKIGLACLALTLCSIKGHAADLDLNWDDAKTAVTREDGTPITGVVDYVIRYSIDNVEQPSITTLVDATSYTVTNIGVGVYAFQIATREDGLQGSYSPVIVKEITAVQSALPGSVTLTIQLTNCDSCGLEIK